MGARPRAAWTGRRGPEPDGGHGRLGGHDDHTSPPDAPRLRPSRRRSASPGVRPPVRRRHRPRRPDARSRRHPRPRPARPIRRRHRRRRQRRRSRERRPGCAVDPTPIDPGAGQPKLVIPAARPARTPTRSSRRPSRPPSTAATSSSRSAGTAASSRARPRLGQGRAIRPRHRADPIEGSSDPTAICIEIADAQGDDRRPRRSRARDLDGIVVPGQRGAAGRAHDRLSPRGRRAPRPGARAPRPYFAAVNLFDLVVLVLVVCAVLIGISSGPCPSSAASSARSAAGALAIVALPLVEPPLEPLEPALRAIVVLAGILLLVGDRRGDRLGARADGRDPPRRRRPRTVDRVLGGVVGAAQALLVVWLIGGLLAAGPMRSLATQAQTSLVVRGLNGVLPAPTEIAVELGRLLDDTGLPDLFVGLEPLPAPPVAQPDDPAAEAIAAAAGRARCASRRATCEFQSSGTGFVVAPRLRRHERPRRRRRADDPGHDAGRRTRRRRRRSSTTRSSTWRCCGCRDLGADPPAVRGRRSGPRRDRGDARLSPRRRADGLAGGGRRAPTSRRAATSTASSGSAGGSSSSGRRRPGRQRRAADPARRHGRRRRLRRGADGRQTSAMR